MFQALSLCGVCVVSWSPRLGGGPGPDAWGRAWDKGYITCSGGHLPRATRLSAGQKESPQVTLTPCQVSTVAHLVGWHPMHSMQCYLSALPHSRQHRPKGMLARRHEDSPEDTPGSYRAPGSSSACQGNSPAACRCLSPEVLSAAATNLPLSTCWLFTRLPRYSVACAASLGADFYTYSAAACVLGRPARGAPRHVLTLAESEMRGRPTR